MFALGRLALPVDTHVYRVSKRLGLVPEKVTREKAAEILREKVPYEMWANFHLGFISHGRAVCKAQRPRCGECMLLKYCPYGKKLLKL
jgi:endonuclease-3